MYYEKDKILEIMEARRSAFLPCGNATCDDCRMLTYLVKDKEFLTLWHHLMMHQIIGTSSYENDAANILLTGIRIGETLAEVKVLKSFENLD